MAKAVRREWVWFQCKECDALNYRTSVNVLGGVPKLERSKFCRRERKHTVHKIKKK